MCLPFTFRKELYATPYWHCVCIQPYFSLFFVHLFFFGIKLEACISMLYFTLTTRNTESAICNCILLRGLFSAAVFCLQCILCNQHIIINTLAVPLREAVTV